MAWQSKKHMDKREKFVALSAEGKIERQIGYFLHLSQARMSCVLHVKPHDPPVTRGGPRKHNLDDDSAIVRHVKRARTEPSASTALWVRIRRGSSLSLSLSLSHDSPHSAQRWAEIEMNCPTTRPSRNVAFAMPATTRRATGGSFSFVRKARYKPVFARTGFVWPPARSLPTSQQSSTPPKFMPGPASRPGEGKSLLVCRDLDADFYEHIIEDCMVPSLQGLNAGHRRRLVVQHNDQKAQFNSVPRRSTSSKDRTGAPATQSQDLNPMDHF